MFGSSLTKCIKSTVTIQQFQCLMTSFWPRRPWCLESLESNVFAKFASIKILIPMDNSTNFLLKKILTKGATSGSSRPERRWLCRLCAKNSYTENACSAFRYHIRNIHQPEYDEFMGLYGRCRKNSATGATGSTVYSNGKLCFCYFFSFIMQSNSIVYSNSNLLN